MRAIYHRIDGIFDWKRGRMHGQQTFDQRDFPAHRRSCLFTTVRRRDNWISDWDWTEGKQEYAKHITQYMLSTFWGVSAKKTLCLYPETVPKKIGQSLEEISLRGGKLVKNFIIFWMNNKTIIEFGFRMMWRIVLCRSRWITSSSIWLWILTSYSASFNSC